MYKKFKEYFKEYFNYIVPGGLAELRFKKIQKINDNNSKKKEIKNGISIRVHFSIPED